MAYLSIIPADQIPLPAVRGLGQARLVWPHRRFRGFGQIATSCAQYIAQQLAALPSAAEAAMLLNTPTPSGAVLATLFINGQTSPAEAAQVVYQWAQEYCGQQADTVTFGGNVPQDCVDGGQACAAAAYPQALTYYSALPASVWTSGTVSAQVANPNIQIGPSTPWIGTTPNTQPLGQPMIQTSNDPGASPATMATYPVAPAPAPAPAPTPTPVPTPAQPTPAQPVTTTSSLDLSWLSNNISLGGLNVPVWGLIAAGFGLVFLMPRGR